MPQPRRKRRARPAHQDRARRLRHLAVPLLAAAARARTSRSSTSRRTAGAATPRRAAASTGRTRPTATAACCSTSRAASIRAGRRVIVVYFHGNLATLERDVQRPPAGAAAARRVRAQCRAGGAAIRRRRRGFQRRPLLGAGRVPPLPRGGGRAAGAAARRPARARGASSSLPVILVAYSGGYHAGRLVRCTIGGAGERVRGVILLDALYAEMDKFADWIASAASRRSSSAPTAGRRAASMPRCSGCWPSAASSYPDRHAGAPGAGQRHLHRRRRRGDARRLRHARPGWTTRSRPCWRGCRASRAPPPPRRRKTTPDNQR